MNKDLDKKDRNEVISHPADHDVEIFDPVQKASPFIRFRYSCREISSGGGQTRIKSKQKSFENGKFKSEEFEGTLPGNVYSNLAEEMQKSFFNQLTTLMKSFSVFLPFGLKDKNR